MNIANSHSNLATTSRIPADIDADLDAPEPKPVSRIDAALAGWEDNFDSDAGKTPAMKISLDDFLNPMDLLAMAGPDKETLIGRNPFAQFLYPGAGALVIGSSGVGKSTALMQWAVAMATGKTFFGLGNPVQKPLKVLIFQNENSRWDMSLCLKGAAGSLTPAELALIGKNLRIRTERVLTGPAFIAYAAAAIKLLQPDVVIADPMLSFLGADPNDNEKIGNILYNQLNPVLDAGNVAWIWIHHTGKPSEKAGDEVGALDSALQYMGLGASIATNWARSILTLSQVKCASAERKVFLFAAPKGSYAAGFTDDEGNPVSRIYIQHSAKGRAWERAAGFDPLAEQLAIASAKKQKAADAKAK